MIFTKKHYSERYRSKFKVNINKQNIQQVEEFKYLGVIIDHKLTWSKHIEYLRTKISQAAGIMKKTISVVPLRANMLLYNSLVDSYLRYGNLSWGTCSETADHMGCGNNIINENTTMNPYDRYSNP